MSETPEIRVQATHYEVNAVREDSVNAYIFGITVEYRGKGLWAVCRHGSCSNAKGKWDYERLSTSRTGYWLSKHRFDLDTALEIAKREALKVTVNGYTVQDANNDAKE